MLVRIHTSVYLNDFIHEDKTGDRSGRAAACIIRMSEVVHIHGECMGGGVCGRAGV